MRKLYRLLSDGRFHSGEELGEALGISRAAIWKKVEKIQKQGVVVERQRGTGYRLVQPVSFLTSEAIQKSVPENTRLLVFDELDSTNDEVKRQLKQQPGPLLVMAEIQTKGRGRRGRSWQSPYASGINMSLAWPVRNGISSLEGLSLVVGLAVYRTLQGYVHQGLGVKWPNDVLVNKDKIAGILIELVGDPADSLYAVIGIGINVNAMLGQLGVDTPWTSLALQTGCVQDRSMLARQLLENLSAMLYQFETEGFVSFSKEWQQAHLWHDRQVCLSVAERVILGRVQGINNKGELLLLVGGRLQAFSGGELSLRLADDT